MSRVLDRYAGDPAAELDRLAAVAAFTVIIGNADAHGKNTAFIIERNGAIRLTSLYNTVPTVLFPRLREEAAMTLGGAVAFGGTTSAPSSEKPRVGTTPRSQQRQLRPRVPNACSTHSTVT